MNKISRFCFTVFFLRRECQHRLVIEVRRLSHPSLLYRWLEALQDRVKSRPIAEDGHAKPLCFFGDLVNVQIRWYWQVGALGKVSEYLLKEALTLPCAFGSIC